MHALTKHFSLDQHPALVAALYVCKRLANLPSQEMTGPVWPPVIAGGAPRDLLLNREPRDFDIFLPVARPWLVGATVEIVNALRDVYALSVDSNLQRDYGLNSYCRPEMLGVITLPRSCVDIVLFDAAHGTTGAQIASTFDASICRAYVELSDLWDFDGGESGTVRTLPDFDRSVAERTIWTYAHIPTRPSHLYRLAKKFPEYRLEITDPKLQAAYSEYCRRAAQREADMARLQPSNVRPASSGGVAQIRPF